MVAPVGRVCQLRTTPARLACPVSPATIPPPSIPDPARPLSTNEDELEPPTGDEVVEEEDVDLDLGELAPPSQQTVLERLQRAAERGSARQPPVGWRDTPVNVTPSGRHEIVEEDEDLTEDRLTLGEAAHAVTRSGRQEIVEEDDGTGMELDDVPGVTPSGRHEVVEEDVPDADAGSFGLGDHDDLDESSLVAAGTEMVEESEFRPDRRDTEPVADSTATVAETRLRPAAQSRDTERGIPREALQARGLGPASADGDDDEEDETETGAHAVPVSLAGDTERSPAVPGFDASHEITAPESDTAQESGTAPPEPEAAAQIPSGASRAALLDNSPIVREEAVATRPESSTPDEQVFSATVAAGHATNDAQALSAPTATTLQDGESAEPEVPGSITPAELGTAGHNEASEKNNTAGGRQDGTVPQDRPQAEPREVHSQRPEGFTVADDSGAPLGRGLDVGTANLVAARMDEEGGIEFFPARNAFLDVPEDPYTLKMLKGQGVPYIKRENRLYVIGEDAFELANIFNREMRRPMKNGLISPTDVDAMPMEVELFKKILGPPRAEGEMVYYSIPADPVDSTLNIVYHTNIANGLLERLGYRGTPFNEGQAIVFSELGDEDFTGIGISCGGGMVNVCVAFRSMNVISFSSAKGGDWIDQQAAQVMGCAASKITAIKERGVDINAPKSPEEEAIVIYYRHLIKYSLENIVKKFAITKDIPNFPKPVAIAISGGTSKVGGFVDVFKDEFSKMASKFPIKISDIRKAEDQLNATAKGCLLAALSHED